MVKIILRKEYLKACSYHVDTKNKNDRLSGVNVSISEGMTYYVGTTGKTLLACRDRSDTPRETDLNITIPFNIVKMIRDSKDIPEYFEVEYDVENTNIQSNFCLPSFHTVYESFPDWKRLMPSKLINEHKNPLAPKIYEAFAKSAKALNSKTHFIFYNDSIDEGKYAAYLNEDVIGIAMAFNLDGRTKESVQSAFAYF